MLEGVKSYEIGMGVNIYEIGMGEDISIRKSMRGEERKRAEMCIKTH